MVSPHLLVIACVDEPRLHAHAISGPLNATLDNRRNTQRLGNLARVVCSVFVLHHRHPRDDSQTTDPAQLSEQLVVKTLRKVSVLFPCAQTGERQHGDRGGEYADRDEQEREWNAAETSASGGGCCPFDSARFDVENPCKRDNNREAC